MTNGSEGFPPLPPPDPVGRPPSPPPLRSSTFGITSTKV
ncbi:hypothetical protein ACN38_g5683, partial [Penicillium nordicum]